MLTHVSLIIFSYFNLIHALIGSSGRSRLKTIMPTQYSMRLVFKLLERIGRKHFGGAVWTNGKFFSLDLEKVVIALITRLQVLDPSGQGFGCFHYDENNDMTFSLVWSSDGTALGNKRSLVAAGMIFV